MNRMNTLLILTLSMLFPVEIFWDLGVGITEFSSNSISQSIQASTFHRLEGTKKYYQMDYTAALFHFEKISAEDRISVLYEYVDCYYSLGHYTKALNILESFDETQLTDNILFLKSKIFLKLDLYNESLNCLLYIRDNFLDSEYQGILMFEIEKINLLNNE